jgi:hypothetical protein
LQAYDRQPAGRREVVNPFASVLNHDRCFIVDN